MAYSSLFWSIYAPITVIIAPDSSSDRISLCPEAMFQFFKIYLCGHPARFNIFRLFYVLLIMYQMGIQFYEAGTELQMRRWNRNLIAANATPDNIANATPQISEQKILCLGSFLWNLNSWDSMLSNKNTPWEGSIQVNSYGIVNPFIHILNYRFYFLWSNETANIAHPCSFILDITWKMHSL